MMASRFFMCRAELISGDRGDAAFLHVDLRRDHFVGRAAKAVLAGALGFIQGRVGRASRDSTVLASSG